MLDIIASSDPSVTRSALNVNDSDLRDAYDQVKEKQGESAQLRTQMYDLRSRTIVAATQLANAMNAMAVKSRELPGAMLQQHQAAVAEHDMLRAKSQSLADR